MKNEVHQFVQSEPQANLIEGKTLYAVHIYRISLFNQRAMFCAIERISLSRVHYLIYRISLSILRAKPKSGYDQPDREKTSIPCTLSMKSVCSSSGYDQSVQEKTSIYSIQCTYLSNRSPYQCCHGSRLP